MSMRKEIKFNNGKFKVMQISDLQDTKSTSVDTLHFVKNAIEKIKPDFIVFTGDQLDVVGMWGKGEKNRINVTAAIKNLFGVIEQFDIPYVLTFGNHDRETGISNEEQAKIYSEFKNCICFDNLDDGRPDCGTFNVPVKSSDGKSNVLNFYIIDSHSSTKREYECVNTKQIKWCAEKSAELAAENNGKPVPAFVFQHIPVPEIYELLKEVPKVSGAVKDYGPVQHGKYFILNSSAITEKGSFGETPAVPAKNNGEFEALKNQGDVMAMFFGHDHYNSFVGTVDGITLGYCPGAGYNTYGLKHRAIRVFEFEENDIKNYKTYTKNYADVCTNSLCQPIKNLIYSNSPSSPEAAGSFAVKCILAIAAFAAVLVLIYNFISKTSVVVLIISLAVATIIYTLVSLIYNKMLRRKILKTGGRK